MKRAIMEPDPRARGITLVESLWLAALVIGVVVLLLAWAD